MDKHVQICFTTAPLAKPLEAPSIRDPFMKQMIQDLRLPLLLIFLINLCAALSLPITPIDETRYVSAAWEMWNNHSFLVPYLNGEPYAHKPPMLFWMMHAGWALFGVNNFTPRLIPGIFSLLSLILVYRISLRLWPQERKTAVCAALILASIVLWDAWSVAIMFDMVLTFWILLGLLGTLRAAEGQRGGWWMLTAGIAGGLLTKGPAVLVYLLSIPLFRVWWDARREPRARVRWVLAVLGAAALGLALALLWAIPAAHQGGAAYGHAILWGQTANRVTESFAHRRPFWWYLPFVPLFFFPWILFRPSLARLNLKDADSGTRFCLAWLGLPLLIFSMISGKQIHYLIPLIPAGALLIGRNIARAEGFAGKTSEKMLGILFLLLGLAALAVPLIHLGGDVGQLESGDTLFAAIGFLLAGLLLLLPFRSTGHTVKRIALTMTLALLCGIIDAKQSLMDNFDIKETAVFIKSKMDAGIPVAHIGKYHGQYQFLGRISQPITVLSGETKTLLEFSARHPKALFISYQHANENRLPEGAKICFSHKYRGKTVLGWELEKRLP
jgi:4-amino-4-deoxy-L-arabinose transferase-like glycosyltransferase